MIGVSRAVQLVKTHRCGVDVHDESIFDRNALNLHTKARNRLMVTAPVKGTEMAVRKSNHKQGSFEFEIQ